MQFKKVKDQLTAPRAHYSNTTSRMEMRDQVTSETLNEDDYFKPLVGR